MALDCTVWWEIINMFHILSIMLLQRCGQEFLMQIFISIISKVNFLKLSPKLIEDYTMSIQQIASVFIKCILLPLFCVLFVFLCSPDTEFNLSLNGKESLTDTGQTLASCGIVSGDLICVILPQSCPAPGPSPPSTSQTPSSSSKVITSSSKPLHKMQEPSTSTTPHSSAQVQH